MRRSRPDCHARAPPSESRRALDRDRRARRHPAPRGELTRNVYPAANGRVDVLYVTDDVRQRRPHPQHRRGRQGVSLRHRSPELASRAASHERAERRDPPASLGLVCSSSDARGPHSPAGFSLSLPWSPASALPPSPTRRRRASACRTSHRTSTRIALGSIPAGIPSFRLTPVRPRNRRMSCRTQLRSRSSRPMTRRVVPLRSWSPRRPGLRTKPRSGRSRGRHRTRRPRRASRLSRPPTA